MNFMDKTREAGIHALVAIAATLSTELTKQAILSFSESWKELHLNIFRNSGRSLASFCFKNASYIVPLTGCGIRLRGQDVKNSIPGYSRNPFV